jgi:hypothetical protein
MSTLVKQLVPTQLLFQPPKRRETASAIPEAGAINQTSPAEPEVRLWKVSTRAVSEDRGIIGLAVLALFLAIAAAGLIYGFVELTHLLQTDAVGHVAAKAISLDEASARVNRE